MANKSIFASQRGRLTPATDTVNPAGGTAYEYEPKHKLVQLAMTGTFADSYYSKATDQLDDLNKTLGAIPDDISGNRFIAQTAIYARRQGNMKDMPAYLLAVLSKRSPALFSLAFSRVVDNGRMLRTFVQIMRSGATGRKSLGSAPKRMIQNWLNNANAYHLLSASIGQDPSLADIVKMVHPKPSDAKHAAFYAWLIDKPYTPSKLPDEVQHLLRFKEGRTDEVPPVPFQLLTALDLKTEHWAEIAANAGWQMVRMNLNTFARHGVFNIPGKAESIAYRLRDEAAIKKSRVMPYQLLAAYMNVGDGVPEQVRDALHDAMEISVENVPEMQGKVVVCPDVSGSMRSPATGYRTGATSAMKCVDIAALVAAAILRRNRWAEVLPFEQRVIDGLRLSGRDTVMTNAERLGSIGGGGTNSSAPLERILAGNDSVDVVVFISDNQSWVDSSRTRYSTGTLRLWEEIKRKHSPTAKMVCIDIQPHGSTQAQERDDIFNLGGFSDAMFTTLARISEGGGTVETWIKEVEAITI